MNFQLDWFTMFLEIIFPCEFQDRLEPLVSGYNRQANRHDIKININKNLKMKGLIILLVSAYLVCQSEAAGGFGYDYFSRTNTKVRGKKCNRFNVIM